MNNVMKESKDSGSAADGAQTGERTFSFGPWATVLWGYRRTLMVTAGFLVAVSAFALLLATVVLPSDRIGSVGFRLTFDGAAGGLYPNGLTFSPNELVSTPVLGPVFDADELSRYGKFETFKSQLYVLQSNPEIELLDFEFQSKLSDSRLTSVDRTKLEQEYQKKRASLLSPDYVLYFRRSDMLATMPPALMAEVLTHVLASWAQQAVDRKNVLRFDIPIFSRRSVGAEGLEQEDYIIGADVLRAQAIRLMGAIDRISALPGAALIRSKSGGLTLAEVRAGVEDTLRFKVQPLIEAIRASGMSKDALGLDLYFHSQLMFAKLKRDEAAQRAQAYDDPLRAYLGETKGAAGTPGGQAGRVARSNESTAVMPQLSDTFLEQVIAFAKQADDVQFRQSLTKRIVAENLTRAELEREVAFYEGLQRTVGGAPPPSGTRDVLVRRVTAQAGAALKALELAADRVMEVYEEVSARNLSPEVGLYRVTAPFRLQTISALSLKRAALMVMIVVMLVVLLVPAACLLHAYARRSPALIQNRGGSA